MPQYRSDYPTIRFRTIYRSCKRYCILHILVTCVLIYLLIALGGGLIPKFLIPRMPFLAVNADINALMFFNVNNDASRITWARAANTKEAVEKAAKSSVHMIEGDVILEGQGTDHQRLVPVMGEPPLSHGDLALVDWLQQVRFLTNKGIKLDFASIHALEIALQRLREFDRANPIHYPVWIHADVLPGPQGDEVMVDPSRFFQTLKREFPRCTVSLGWTTGPHSEQSDLGYTWDQVLDMYNLVRKWRIEDQPVVFQARLSLIRNSVPQLKWLVDNVPHSALSVLHVEGDQPLSEDMMYVAYRFSLEEAFFDLQDPKLQDTLTKYRHFSQPKVNALVGKRDEVVFKPLAWVKMGQYEEEDFILPSSEALVMTSPHVYVVSKSQYRPTSQIYLLGRVQFLNRNKVLSESFSTGLNIYLRPRAYAHYDHIVGIRCFLGADGEMEVNGSHLPKAMEAKTARIKPGSEHCFRFHVTDTGPQVIFRVITVRNCQLLESVVPEVDGESLAKGEMDGEVGKGGLKENYRTLVVDLPYSLPHDQAPFILRLQDDKRQAVVDELSIKHIM